MSEETKNEKHDDGNESDSSLGSHRDYDEDDPYKDLCKQVDAREDIIRKQNKVTVNKVAKKVIENKENITKFEKYAKNAIAFTVLACIIVANRHEIKRESFIDLSGMF